MRRTTATWPVLAATILLASVAAPSAAARRHHRAGCGRFCQQGGGLGGGPGEAATIIHGRSLVLHAGVVRVRVTCRRTTACIGRIVIEPVHFPLPGGVPAGSYNGVDLSLARGRTATLEVPLLAAAQTLVAKRRRLLVEVLVQVRDNATSGADRTMTLRPG